MFEKHSVFVPVKGGFHLDVYSNGEHAKHRLVGFVVENNDSSPERDTTAYPVIVWAGDPEHYSVFHDEVYF